MQSLIQHEDDFNTLISKIRQKTLLTSYEVALETEALVKKVIAEAKWDTTEELIQLVTSYIKKFTDSLPQETIPCNVMRHILKITREVYATEFKTRGEKQQSLHQILTTGTSCDTDDYKQSLPNLRSLLLGYLSEYEYELEESCENISAQASEHIHANEIILTVGKSRTVENFLKAASKTRKFEVLVVQNNPPNHAHTMAENLAKANISTTIIPDTGIFAIMSRVNKVIVGAHSVMANGVIKTTNSIHMAAAAAKHYSVAVMVLTHMYKFTPLYLNSQQQDEFNCLATPASLVPRSIKLGDKILMECPMFDYVPPELITLIITHHGGNDPSYIYHLFSELYHRLDTK